MNPTPSPLIDTHKAEATPVAPKAAPAPQDPSWWRLGSIPFLVLLMVVAAADLAWPRPAGWGIGAGIGCFLAINALLFLRRDFTRGEYWFLQGLAALNMLALICTGSFINWMSSLVIPFIVVMLPTSNNYTDKQVGYRNWWSFWFARRVSEEKKGRFSALRKALPLLICILIGVLAFVAFLCIFASGNPVVQIVWETLVNWWNRLVDYLHISWDFWVHVLYWLAGFAWFGIYCFNRIQKQEPLPAIPSQPTPAGTTLLPYLPLCILIGINAAFAVATSTDIAFLWFGKVPEGVSQTAYLHEGATSITWASVLAAGVLVLLFRPRGMARHSVAGRIFGYLLVVQTALLAISVYMRLYHQIEDFGFTVRRIQAAEALLMGLAALIILVLYMATNGAFWKYTRICLGTMLLMLIAFASYSPARLAGNLNLIYVGSHPHWSFTPHDFRINRFDVNENLAFAEYVHNKHKDTDPESDTRYYALNDETLREAAQKVEKRASTGSWLTFNLSIKEDLPAAERILGRPITIKMVEQEEN